jgi:hypothetical protein
MPILIFLAIYFLFVGLIGVWLTDAALFGFLGVDVFWVLDLVIAIFAGPLTAPLGIVALILEAAGVPMPMFVAGAN